MNFRVEKTVYTAASVNASNDDEITKKLSAKAKGEFIVGISSKDATLYSIAKKFGMKPEEFKKMTGLTKDALKKGQVIKNIPHARIPAGKGLKYLAEKNGMKLEELLELNNIDKNYTPQKDEYFYVYPPADKKTSVKKQEINEQPATPDNTPARRAAKSQSITPSQQPPSQTPRMTPEDIAQGLKEAVYNNVGAVGKEDFSKFFKQIKQDNIIDVLKAYDKISPKETLIDAICSETSSPKELRKDAVMTIYDDLAKKLGSKLAQTEFRTEFKKELDKEFSSIGFVSTKKLDGYIRDYIISYENDSPVHSSKPDKAGNTGGITRLEVKDSRKVHLGNGRTMTAGELKKSADNDAARENRPVSRPLPTLDKNGNIVADVKVHEPTGNGVLKGKTIIINAGHGGYNPKNGIFDPGTDAKDANGKVIEEWYKNKNFTDKIIPELTAKGAKVVFMNGSAASIMKAKAKNKNADLFISIHCDAAPNKPDVRGQSIIYRDNSTSKKLAQIVESNIENHDWIDKTKCKVKPDDRGLGVLRSTSSIPSILIETGYQSNPKDLANIDSNIFREEFAKNLANAVVEYFK